MKSYPKYKESEVDLIGKIPEHWKIKRLKYLLKEKITDGPHETPKFIDNGVPFLSVDSIQDGKIIFEGCRFISKEAHELYKKKCKLERNDILMGKAASIGKIAKVNVDFEFGVWSPLAVIKSNQKIIDPTYLEYSLKSPEAQYQIEILCTSNTQKNISMDDIPKIVLSLPDVSEQKAIDKFLDNQIQKLDSLIDKRNQMIELLNEKRAAIINNAVTKGINPNVKMKDSGIEWIGKISENWDLARIKHVVVGKLEYGANESAELDDDKLPRYIRITDFGDDGKLRTDTFRSLPNEIAKYFLLKEGDILFARSGATVGKTFQFKGYGGSACFAGYLIKASPDTKKIISDFLYYLTKSSLYENWKNSIFIQSTIQNIGADKYSMLKIPLPPIPEQLQIVKFIETETSKIDRTLSQFEQEIALLQEYKIALISEAVTGKIDVREEVQYA